MSFDDVMWWCHMMLSYDDVKKPKKTKGKRKRSGPESPARVPKGSHTRSKSLHPLQDFTPDTRAYIWYKILHPLQGFAPVTGVYTLHKSLHSLQECKLFTRDYTLDKSLHPLQKFKLFTRIYILYKSLHPSQEFLYFTRLSPDTSSSERYKLSHTYHYTCTRYKTRIRKPLLKKEAQACFR